jgi:hypothetical protein
MRSPGRLRVSLPPAQLAAAAVASRRAMKALMRSIMRATSGSGQPADGRRIRLEVSGVHLQPARREVDVGE